MKKFYKTKNKPKVKNISYIVGCYREFAGLKQTGFSYNYFYKIINTIVTQSIAKKLSLEDYLHTINKRHSEILFARFGLKESSQTLQEVAVKMNLTRERVRQIEKVALSNLYAAIKNGDIIENIFLIITKYAEDITQIKSIKLPSHLSSEGVVKLCNRIDDELIIYKNQNINEEFLILKNNFEKCDKIINEAINCLSIQKGYVDVLELAKLLQCNPDFLFSMNNCYFDGNFIALKSNKNIFTRNNIRLIEKVLENAGRPLDIKTIIQKTKLRSGQINGSIDRSDRLVNVGPSTYALTDWGYIKGHIADVAEYYLKLANEPMKLQNIVSLVTKQRFYGSGSVVSALNFDKRFQRIDLGVYALREWGYEEEYKSNQRHYDVKSSEAIIKVVSESSEALSQNDIKLLVKKRYKNHTSTLDSTLSANLSRLVENNKVKKIVHGRNVYYCANKSVSRSTSQMELNL